MRSPHHQARRTIEPLLLGEIEEIATRVPRGFYRHWPLSNLSVDDYLAKPYRFVATRILHILLGEGESSEEFVKVLEKALGESLRVLILEHNPAAEDWRESAFVTSERLALIKRILEARRLKYSQIFIGRDSTARNILYNACTIPLLDYCRLDAASLVAAGGGLAGREGWPGGYDSTKKILALTSENRAAPARLLSPELVELCDRHAKTYCSVIGGMMFLEALAQIAPQSLLLFDRNFLQCVYAAFVVEAILECKGLTEFDRFLAQPEGLFGSGRRDAIDRLWKFEELRSAVAKSRLRDRHWRNVLYLGVWRERYELVRRRLGEAEISIVQSDLENLWVPDNAVVYTSTIPRSAVRRFLGGSQATPLVIHCLERGRRDEPVLLASSLDVVQDLETR